MQSNSAIVRRFISEVLNDGHIDSAGEFFWDDMVEQVPLPGQGPGLEGLKDVLRGLRAAFPDMHWTVEEQIAEGDKVVTRFEWTGTHRGEFFGVSATGRSVKVWGVVIDRLEAGKIKDTRILMDTMGLMMQLGALVAGARRGRSLILITEPRLCSWLTTDGTDLTDAVVTTTGFRLKRDGRQDIPGLEIGPLYRRLVDWFLSSWL